VTRMLLRGVGLLAAGAVLYLVVTAAQVVAASRQDDARPAQAIVVMGSAEYDGVPSPDLRARLDHALELWRRGLAPVVVVTGGAEPGDRYSESEVSATYLEDRRVPRSAVWEVAGRNSWQSLDQAARLLRSRGATRVLLVSDPFHSARIADISAQLGLTGYPSPTNTSPIRGLATVPYFAKETLGVAVGRVVGFERLSGLSA
jgi:uncharacterized SAM-binding protein YcdF (DUF218 family)